MDAENRWWVSEFLAADCERAWIHPGWEDTMHKWYEWLWGYMKKKDEKEKMEEMHKRKVEKMNKRSAEERAGLLHKITKPTMWSGVQILEKEEEDARLLDRCEAKRKEWLKHWQCNEEIQSMQDKPWKNEECEETLPRLTEGDSEKASRLYKENTGVGCDGFHPKVPLDLTKETRGENHRVLGEGGTEWQMAATSLPDDILLDSSECHERETNCADADVDTLVGSLDSTRSGKIAAQVPSGVGLY